jgi:hypothetical protein
MSQSRAMKLLADGAEWLRKNDVSENVAHYEAATCFYQAMQATSFEVANKLGLHLHSQRAFVCFYGFMAIQFKSLPQDYRKVSLWRTCFFR